MLAAREELDIPGILRNSGLEIFLPLQARQALPAFPAADPAHIRYYDPYPAGNPGFDDFLFTAIEDNDLRDRLVIGPQGMGLWFRPDFISFLHAGLAERNALTITARELSVHPYRFIRMERNGNFRHWLALPDEQRGFRQFFPRTFDLEPLLTFVPAQLSVQAAVGAGRLKPFVLSDATEWPAIPKGKCHRQRSAAGNDSIAPDHWDTNTPALSAHLPHKRNPLGMEFVLIPGGSFSMGTPGHERPRDIDETRKKVEVDSFWLQTAPVTQAQYTALCQKNPSAFLGSELPVHGVTIFDALHFTAALAQAENLPYRLPREYEWEFACARGGQDPELFRYPEKLDAMAWYRTNADGAPHAVGRKQPNAFGLYDLLGNVKELTRDIYAPDYDPAHKSLAQFLRELWPGSPVAVRGGNFNSPAHHLRPAARAFVVAQDYSPNPGVGFRLALDVE